MLKHSREVSVVFNETDRNLEGEVKIYFRCLVLIYGGDLKANFDFSPKNLGGDFWEAISQKLFGYTHFLYSILVSVQVGMEIDGRPIRAYQNDNRIQELNTIIRD